MGDSRYSIEDLLQLMARLRDPQTGCPWDLKQDFQSIVPHTIEEAYEVADAIERGDMAHLPDELGDLLFQVVFYARMGQEQTRFDFSDVVDGVTRKLLRRHPHVFPGGTLDSRREPGETPSDAAIGRNWDAIKAEEARATDPEPGSVLDDVTAGLPAFQRSAKLQKRASKVGFDWPDTSMVFDKLHEETEELREAWQNQKNDADKEAVEDELGDLLFVCVNLSRFLGVDAEQALRRANLKFERRFRRMEQNLGDQQGEFHGLDIDRLETLWQQAKADLEKHGGDSGS